MRKTVREVVNEVYNKLKGQKPSYKVLERFVYELLEKKKIDFSIQNNHYSLPSWAGDAIIMLWWDREDRKYLRKLRAQEVKKIAKDYRVSIRRAQQIFNAQVPLEDRVSFYGDKRKRKRRSK